MWELFLHHDDEVGSRFTGDRRNLPMKLTLLLLMSSLMMGCAGGMNNAKAKKEYGYIFEETTGESQYILADSQRLPITFSERSNKMALQSLRALKPSVLYGNSGGEENMFVVGEYDVTSHSFLLDRWYIKVPFVEYAVEDETHVPHVIHKLSRTSLERTDFEAKDGFDPSSPSFDPRLFEKRSSSQHK